MEHGQGQANNTHEVRSPGRRGFLHRVLAPALALCLVMATLAGGIPRVLAQDPGVARMASRLQSDRFVDRIIDGEKVACMYGNVFIDRDTLTARSDTAFYFRDREFYRFLGNVVLTRQDGVLTCRRADYDQVLGQGDFFGDVRLEEKGTIGTSRRGETREAGRFVRLIGDALLVTPDYSVKADTIFQDRLKGSGEAFGHVKIMEPGAKNLVTGDHAVFASDNDMAEVDRNPVLTSREQAGGPLTSTAGLMRFFRSEDRVVMIDSVRINQDQTNARADTAVAYGQEQLVLTGDPEVSMSGTSIMRGDRIDFFYADGKIDEVVLVGSARMEDAAPDSMAILYQGIPGMDILEGDSIHVAFEDEKISRSVVVGNARSRYTPQDLTDEVATNDVSGDTIIINFRDEQVRRVKVIGNAEGQYKFAKIAAMRKMLGESRRLVDQLARGGADSTALADSLVASGVPAEKVQAADSLMVAALDSLASAGFDTSQSGMDFLANAETVDYAGRLVTFEMADRTMEIQDQGSLRYGTLKMDAEHIMLDTDNRELYAEGQPLVEEKDIIAGQRMGYNFEHKTAAVEDGVTAFEEYYYVGDSIRRFPDQTMKICGGQMTSCDNGSPHYHFWSQNMKMRPGDKVVAAPVVVKIGHVPVFALPFYYKSLKSGRQSGILFPSFDFGWSSRDGRYIRDFGYYWATNDNMDFLVEGDYNERSDFGFRVSNRYVKRYAFNGGIDFSRKIGLRDVNDTNEWQLRWNHNQPTLFDDYKFRADVKLASTTLSSNDLTGSNNRDIVSGQLKSNVYVSRNWDFLGTSVNASRDERVNAADSDFATDNQIYSMTLPSVSLSFRQLTLAPALRGGQRGSFAGDLLRNTYFSQSYSLRAGKVGYEVKDIQSYDANGSWGLSLKPPRLGVFNVSFNANAAQAWTRVDTTGQVWRPDTNFVDGGYYEELNSTFEDTRPSLSFGTTLGTTMYGLFPLEVGRMKALRHTLRFNTSWNVTPAIRDRQDYRTSFGVGFDNRFDLKYLSAENDTTLTEKKLDGVIDWSLRSSYSPQAANGRLWSDISSGLTIKPGQSRYLALKVSNAIDPYTLALKSTRFSYGLNFSGRLDVGEVAAEEERERNEAIDRLGVDLAAAGPDSTLVDEYGNPITEDPFDTYEQDQLFDGEDSSFNDFYDRPGRQEGPGGNDPTEGGRFIPFDVRASLSYSYTNASSEKRANGNISLNTNLTRNWEFRYQASFDIVTGSATRQQYSIHRDLHCWRFEFNRTISAVDSQFGFRIYLKSIPSLKYSRGREDYMGSVTGGLGGGVF